MALFGRCGHVENARKRCAVDQKLATPFGHYCVPAFSPTRFNSNISSTTILNSIDIKIKFLFLSNRIVNILSKLREKVLCAFLLEMNSLKSPYFRGHKVCFSANWKQNKSCLCQLRVGTEENLVTKLRVLVI